MEAAEGIDNLGAQIEGGVVNGADAVGGELAAGAEAAQAGAAAAGEGAGAAVGGGEIGAGVAVGVETGLEVGALAAQTAQADSIPLDLQDGDVATADASLKKVQAKGVTNPVQLAMLAGKPESQAAAAPLTAFQNILVLAPQQAQQARAPTALPSAIQARAATPVKTTTTASGGRKMLQSSSYPDCCNTYTVTAGDTLDSIAAAYGQPDNGAKIMQARIQI
ncbi:hypothetical protein WJX75_008068 [Coccomyxa subellipsoidea]|uniref:LysM domain-containing protein n=1 Tax=Coccomyxa subellipsoidea TaxID=248742 RepID=A0ABR2YIK6_9CHLO